MTQLPRAEDAISQVSVDLKEQSIYLKTIGANKETKMDAQELSANLLDTKSNRAYLVIAEAGSGKSWTVQQIALAMCTQFLEGATARLPITIAVQRLVGAVGVDKLGEALQRGDNEAAEFVFGEYIKLGDAIPGVVLDDFGREALMGALRMRRVVLLIDGVDEASSHSESVELFARRCAAVGLQVLVSSRPEGIASRTIGHITHKNANGSYDVEYGSGETEKGVHAARARGVAGEGNMGEIVARREGNVIRATSFDVLFDDGKSEEKVHQQRIKNISSKGKIVTGQNGRKVDASTTAFEVVYEDGVNEYIVERARITSEGGNFALSEGDEVSVKDRPLALGNRVHVQKPLSEGDQIEVEHGHGGLFRYVDGWEILGLPKLSLEQQQRLVDNVLAKTKLGNSTLEIFFENLFHFTYSREKFDALFNKLGAPEKQWLKSMAIDLSTSSKPMQVANDGKSVDDGLRRSELKEMFAIAGKLLQPKEGESENMRKEREKTLQKEWIGDEKVFRGVFQGMGKRVFELFKIAQVANDLFAVILQSVCSRARGSVFSRALGKLSRFSFKAAVTYVTCGLKGILRSLEKAIQDYSKEGDEFGGLHKVLDIVRGTIKCLTVAHMRAVMDALVADPRVTIIRFKNLFKDLDPTHFRRFAVNFEVCVSVDGGVVRHTAELQIHLLEFFEFKQENKGLMHKPYEYFREAGPKEEVMPRLQQQMDTMNEIRVTPVLLSLFCATVECSEGERPVLPLRLSELYKSALNKRLKGHDGLQEFLQAAAFDNFINANRRIFNLKDAQEAFLRLPSGSAKPPNFDSGSVPFLKTLDMTTGLLQFPHLSFQEALASLEARQRLEKGQLESQFVRKYLFSKKAANFLNLSADGAFPFPSKVGKSDFSNDYTPQDFIDNLDVFDRPCRIFENMVELDLEAAGLRGEWRKYPFYKNV